MLPEYPFVFCGGMIDNNFENSCSGRILARTAIFVYNRTA
jgi:hypothetical protein